MAVAGGFLVLAASPVVLATVDPKNPPAIGAALALLLTIVALGLLITLIYTTVSQMRPENIVRALHDRALKARRDEHALLGRTRRRAEHGGPVRAFVRARGDGFLTGLDLDAVAEGLGGSSGMEIRMMVTIGDHIAYDDHIGEV